MKTLVTGGAGFIGSNLVDQLVKLDHEVIVLDNLSTGRLQNLNQSKDKIKFVNVNIISNNETFANFFNGIDWVFHLAGIADIVRSIKNPGDYFDTNVKGTFNVLEASRKAKVKKFIYAASASCYGIPDKYPTGESSKVKPEYPYALSKFLGEEMLLHWAKVYDMHNISLRFFNAYGSRSRTTGAYGAVFGVFLAQKLANKPLTIVGDGKQTRDFIHVADLVNAIVLAAEKGKKGEVYNVGGGREVTINEIAKLIGGETVSIGKRPGEPYRSLADIFKIKKELGWDAKISISDGVSMLLKNLSDWQDAPVWTPEKISEATKDWFKILGNKK